MTIYQLNIRKYHITFRLSLLLFGFSMARVLTMILRIIWAEHTDNLRLMIASNIFTNAGILVIFILNLLLAQRILRAEQPHLGWSKALRTPCKALYALTGGVLVMIITAAVLSFYTRNTRTLKACRDIQLAATTYRFVFTTLPIFHVAAAHVLPKSVARESLGRRDTGTAMKEIIVTVASLLSIIGIGFKVGTAYTSPRLRSDPAWYHSKAAFYCFNFVLEIMILALLTFSRIDRLFWVPDGSKGPGDYTRLAQGSTGREKGVGLESLDKA